MIKLALFVLVLLPGLSFAQAGMQIGIQRPAEKTQSEPHKPTPMQLKQGRQMLETAEAQAAGLQGGMRSYALLQLARTYKQSDNKKALQLLEEALTATRAIDDDRLQTRSRLQEQILQEMVSLSPQRVDELLSEVEPAARGTALNSLLRYYEQHKDLDRAVELLYRMAQETEMPYGAVLRVIEKLPPERASDAQQLFAVSLASFENSKRTGLCMGDCDFAALIVRLWNRLPKQAVLDAIQTVLKDAREHNQAASVSMSSAKGAVAFNSYYEFRLFQLLPVLRQLDESAAKQLLQDYQQVQTLLGKYPQGTDSLQPPEPPDGSPEESKDKRPSGGTSFMVNSGGGGGGRGGPAMPSPVQMQQVSRIAADAEKHPRDALANCATIADSGLRSQALLMVAETTWKKEGSIAREALQKFTDLAPNLELQQQIMSLRTAARIYLDMADTDDAKSVIEKGIAAADKAYAKDNDADDPNRALKAYWPSAEAYRSMLRLAATVSPAWAASLAKEISDPDMRTVAQIAMAGALLEVPAGSTTMMTTTKKGENTMTSIER